MSYSTNASNLDIEQLECLENDNNSKHDINLINFSNFMQLYYLPCIVTIGILGNALTIIIILSENKLNGRVKRDRYNRHGFNTTGSTNTYHSHKTTNTFILGLALSDLVYNFVLALVWLSYVEIYDIVNKNYFCQISIAVTYICSFLSAAFTTLFTFQRFMAIVKPLKLATGLSLQSPRVVHRLIFAIFLSSLIIYSFSFFLYDNSPKKEHSCMSAQEICGINEKYTYLVYFLDNTLDSFLTLIIPAIGILFMNTAICKSLNYNTSKQNFLYKQDAQSEMQLKSLSFSEAQREPDSDSPYADSRVVSSTASATSNKKLQVSRIYIQQHSSSKNKITKTLLIVSFVFIILNSPYRASKLVSFIRMSISKNYVYSNLEYAIDVLLINLYFTSYSVNFFLYSICGKRFRTTCKSLFSRYSSFKCFKSPSPPSTYTSPSTYRRNRRSDGEY